MIQIGERKVGPDYPCFIVGECGINAGTDINIAKQLIDVAVKAKCDAVKFQTFKQTKKRNYPNLSYEDFPKIKKYCDEKGIIFFATPFELYDIDFLNPLVPVYKIASQYLTQDYFVKRIRTKGKPVICSTGSLIRENKKATFDEVDHFLSLMNANLALLYCVSKYPCYDFDSDDFEYFKSKYDNYPIGFSSHSKDIEYSIKAAELGACIVEQHITLGDDFKCIDSNVSLNPQQLTELVKQIREMEK